MPRYTCHGHIPRFGADILDYMPVPCAVHDATGRVIEWTFYADTETGEVGRYDRSGGRFHAGPDGDLLTIWDRHPAPLTLRLLR